MRTRYYAARLAVRLTLYVVVCGAAFQVRAVVDANSRSNTNAPTDGSPWTHVGGVNGAGGIYLGNGWVLTAFHVGAGNIVLGGATYTCDGDSKRLTNSDGSATDLLMFHLATRPALTNLPLASVTPSGGARVNFIGYGHIAGSAQTQFGSLVGFYWSAGEMKSWGNNVIDWGGVGVINAGLGNLSVFATTFDAAGGSQTSHEAQGAPGDSGGGVFLLGGSGWELVGVMDEISVYPGQPANTSVFGNRTYSADIATYRAQIDALLYAPPRLNITRSGANVVVSWTDSGDAYDLEMTGSLVVPGWSVVTESQVWSQGRIYVSVPATGGPAFFRLHLQGDL